MREGLEAGMFLAASLEKILADREVRRHTQLKKACESALEELKGSGGGEERGGGVLPSSPHAIPAERYFLPLELACKTASPTIIITALDCLQKLIAYGHLEGGRRDPAGGGQLVQRLVPAICECFQGPHTPSDVQLQVIKALLTAVITKGSEVHEGALLAAVKTCYNLYLASKNSINQATARAALTQILNYVFANMEASVNPARESGPGEEESDLVVAEVLQSLVERVSQPQPQLPEPSEERAADGEVEFKSVWEKDAFLVFRALCRLSMKEVGDKAEAKSHELRSKLLSLDLLLLLLQDAKPGSHFATSPLFAAAIKQYLCLALSKNGVSNNAQVFELSLNIFLALMEKFKTHLKVQVEVFFKEIFLSILEAPTSPFRHKWLVMEALCRICEDPQGVVDLYVNYDCDLGSENILERLIADVSKVAQGRGALQLGALPGAQTEEIRLKGLQCLVSLLRCMALWSRDLYVDPAVAPSQVDSPSHLPPAQTPAANAAAQSLPNGGSPNQSSDNLGDGAFASAISNSSSAYLLEQQKQQKDIVLTGIKMFNEKWKKGLSFLQEQKLVGQSAQEVAKFLHSEERLDKSVVGDFLGENETFCKETMYAYVDQLDFAGMDFVSALRLFLLKFRLPGEAQKIDRLMEKFASRYCETNRGGDADVFASADTAYVLAYSIIMLTTDLHSPQVRNKMTKEQYIRMNRGINDSADLPVEFLSAIYDQIAGKEITMKAGGGPKRAAGTGAPSERERRLLWNLETSQMEAAAKSLMEAASHAAVSFTSATHSEHVGPMFKLAWTPCLAAFSIGLQGGLPDSPDHPDPDDHIPLLCLQGFQCAIRVAGIFGMKLELNAYVSALARFTLLTAGSTMAEMKAKNIACIKTLIIVAHTDGNYLGSSWLEILRVISQLELAQLIGTGVKPTPASHSSSFLRPSPEPKPSERSGASDYVARSSGLNLSPQTVVDLQESLGETSSQSVVVAVDRIFTGSVRLDGDSIVAFVEALCQISKEELSSPKNPRMFSLQKLVEISYYNMGRIRLQWSRVWRVLGDYFNEAGCVQREEVAFFVVDSLRQLSANYIQQGELANFRFQKDFMRPFEYIVKHHPSLAVRELVVRCCCQMVTGQAAKIKSGWKCIFGVFQSAAGETEESVVELAFGTTSDVVSGVYGPPLPQLLDSFTEAVACLSEFACNAAFPDVSMEAIRLIRLCAKHVAENKALFVDGERERDREGEGEDEDGVWLRGWFPVVFELSCIISRCKLDVRTRGLTVMFEIMKTYGAGFKPAWWRDLFAVAFKIFNVMKLPEVQTERAEWMMTTCNHALYAIVDVFSQYFHLLQDLVLPDLYDQLQSCIQSENEQLARSAIFCLENLVVTNGHRFSKPIWTKTVALFLEILHWSRPQDLLTWKPGLGSEREGEGLEGEGAEEAVDGDITQMPQPSSPSARSEDSSFFRQEVMFAGLRMRCVVQLETIEAVHAVLFGPGASRKEERTLEGPAPSRSQPHAAPSQALPAGDENLSQPANQRRDFAARTSRLASEGGEGAEAEEEDAGGMYSALETEELLELADALVESHELAKAFNRDQAQRTLLWKAGLGRSKPNLIQQETRALRYALKVLFRLYGAKAPSGASSHSAAEVQNRLMSVCRGALAYYGGLEAESHKRDWLFLLHLLLRETQRLPPAQFAELGLALKPHLEQLVETENQPPLRRQLRLFVSRLVFPQTPL